MQLHLFLLFEGRGLLKIQSDIYIYVCVYISKQIIRKLYSVETDDDF